LSISKRFLAVLGGVRRSSGLSSSSEAKDVVDLELAPTEGMTDEAVTIVETELQKAGIAKWT
jgi:hypothetical protein